MLIAQVSSPRFRKPRLQRMPAQTGTPMESQACPSCGARAGGRAECQGLFDQLRKPLALRVRGAVTVADVHAAPNSDAYAARVREWARSVWEAYASQQDLARAWMRAAIAGVSSRR